MAPRLSVQTSPAASAAPAAVDVSLSQAAAAANEKSSRLGGLPAPPLAPPPFTLAQLRAAVPAHCFERSALRSLGHVAVDLAIVAALAAAAAWGIPALPAAPAGSPAAGAALRAVAWLCYWYAQGAVLTGVWVLAHECGHGAFSDSAVLNDVVGWCVATRARAGASAGAQRRGAHAPSLPPLSSGRCTRCCSCPTFRGSTRTPRTTRTPTRASTTRSLCPPRAPRRRPSTTRRWRISLGWS
jgi:hypothetical protein